MIDLAGVLIPATTPYDSEGEVDRAAMRSNVARWMASGIHGLLTAGSTGESVLLDESERIALVEVAREVMQEGQVLLAGTGSESTRQTIRLTEAAAGAGADAVLVQPPAYYRGAMKRDVLRDHFVAVADASPIPVLVYQVPLRLSTVELPTDLVGELSGHANVVGMKDSRGDMEILSEVVGVCEVGFQLLVGSGAVLYGGLDAGAVGGIVAVAAMAPDAALEVHRSFVEGRKSESERIQEQITPVHNEIVGGTGVPGVKRSLDLLGYSGGDPRSPLRPLDDAGQAKVRSVLEGAGLLDTP